MKKNWKPVVTNRNKDRVRQIKKLLIKKDPNRYKEYLIRRALSSPAGMKALAARMSSPARCGGKDVI